jgi:hypothetical protein
MRLRIPGIFLLTSLVLGTFILPAGATTISAPFARMKGVITKGDTQHSVRWTATDDEVSSHLTVITDAGRTVGRQNYIYSNASGQQGTAVVEFVKNTIYARGDALVLNMFFEMPAATATTLANRWFIVPKSNPKYALWLEGLTIPSAIDQFAMTNPVVTNPTSVVNGQTAGVLSGTSAGTPGDPPIGEILYYRSTGSPLPVEVTQNRPGLFATVTFSRWNVPVVIGVPRTKLLYP